MSFFEDGFSQFLEVFYVSFNYLEIFYGSFSPIFTKPSARKPPTLVAGSVKGYYLPVNSSRGQM